MADDRAALAALLDVRHEEDGSWSVSIRAMPGHVGCADTLAEAYVEAHDAALAWVEAVRDMVPARALALPPDPEWLAVALHAGGIGPTGVDGHWLCQGVEHHASDAAFIAAWPKP